MIWPFRKKAKRPEAPDPDQRGEPQNETEVDSFDQSAHDTAQLADSGKNLRSKVLLTVRPKESKEEFKKRVIAELRGRGWLKEE